MASAIENPFEEQLADIRSVIDDMSFGLFARDPEGRIVFANDALLKRPLVRQTGPRVPSLP